ncbi:nucleoside deaminase [Lutimonas saemankumensis]|uniref:nucleoside deaminase n=1 Tax=Lutimonas saemankumensis TaxID=483016 RepID=UPI0021D427CD|nr:nucleoside deaminase [Lutimonas saemankumensis]
MCNNFNKKFIDEAAKALNDQNDEVSNEDTGYMDQATAIAIKGVIQNEGGPFGCVIVKDGEIIGRGNNKVTSTNDPTAHAEIIAIREACKHLDSFQLEGCIIYTNCEPCPMCLGAIYWARPEKVYYGCNKTDAAKIGFDDNFIYQELNLELSKRKIPFEQLNREEALKAFKTWKEKEDKIEY